MSTRVDILVPTAFGLEAVVAREVQQLGYEDSRVENGRVMLSADISAVARLNLWLRSGERVLLQIGEFDATDFDQLFDQTTALPWEAWLPVSAAFPVVGKSSRSQLTHVPSCQSIIKKAIVERLKKTYRRQQFEESGPEVPIEFSIISDRVVLALNTSGAGLHKRGYRARGGKAPLKETLAAGLVQLSFWNADRPFWDPFCGTGTIAIEAAMRARNIAPGRNRQFVSEKWPAIAADVWESARQEADDLQRPPLEMKLNATDVDFRILRTAREAAKQAGVLDDIHFQDMPVQDVSSRRKYGCLICNPPYGERVGSDDEVDALYRDMGRVFSGLETWSFFVLTSHKGFEKLIRRKADRRRKLYNGRIECTYYQFHGDKPPSMNRRSKPETVEEPGE